MFVHPVPDLQVNASHVRRLFQSLHITLSPQMPLIFSMISLFSLSYDESPSAPTSTRVRTVPTWATNHCMDTASPSNNFPMRSSMLLLRVRIIPPISLLLCSAAPLELSSHLGDGSATVSLSRLTLMAWSITVHEDSAVPKFLQAFKNDFTNFAVANALDIHVARKLGSQNSGQS